MKIRQSALKYSIAAALAAMSGSVAASAPAALDHADAYGRVPAELPLAYNPAGMPALADAYMVAELDPKLKVGVTLDTPAVAPSNYTPTWGWQAINPAVSYQLNDAVSVGAGLSYHSVSGEWNSAALAPGANGGRGRDGLFGANGNDSSYGYNLGTLINVGTQTRVGLAYRSQMKPAFSNASSALPGVGKVANGDMAVNLAMPDTFSSSVVYQLNPQLDLLADVTWSGWSTLQGLDALSGSATTLGLTPENWRNTWHGSVGATQRYSEQWMARFGVAYDQVPLADARIADRDRTWFALGGQYKFTADSALDFGYSHVLLNNASLNQDPGAGAALPGTYSGHANIYSLQYGHHF